MSSDACSSSTTTTTGDLCAVCGAVASGRRYGAMACLGCIVFFRRTVLRRMRYRCQRQGNCQVTVETRCVCRSCRLEKCLAVGMNPDAIQIRDIIGPRRPRADGSSSAGRLSSRSTISPQTPQFLPSPPGNQSFPPSLTRPAESEFDVLALVELQKEQWEKHRKISEEEEEKFTEGCVFMKNDYHRRATSSDINRSLKLAIIDSTEFASQFKFFKDLDQPQRNTILSEYAIAFMLIDQAYKTVQEADEGFWLLQNGSFLGLHPDFKFENDIDENKEKAHFEFVTQLLTSIGAPFKSLGVDETERAVLKCFLLLNTSLQNVDHIRAQWIQALMERSGPERFGEIILLISSIRCAVKAFYNITKVSDLFDVNNFDQFVKDVFVE